MMNDVEMKSQLERILAEGSGWPGTKGDWYHQMDLGFGLKTPGAPLVNLVPVAALMKRVRFDGLKCLDLGTMDGKAAFLMENLNAARIVAVDLFNRNTVPALIGLFGSRVEYEFGVRVGQIAALADRHGAFDFVLCSGVLYHVYSPLDVVLAVRRLTKTGGLALFESAALADEKEPALHLNCGRYYGDHTTLWVPTVACVRTMLRFACFRILDEASIAIPGQKPIRHAVVARAVRPSEFGRDDVAGWLSDFHLGKAEWPFGYQYLLPQYDPQNLESAESTEVVLREGSKKSVRFRSNKPRDFAEEQELLDRGTPADRRASAS